MTYHLTQWCHSTDIDGRAQLCAVLRRTEMWVKKVKQLHVLTMFSLINWNLFFFFVCVVDATIEHWTKINIYRVRQPCIWSSKTSDLPLHSVMPQYCSDIHIKETSQYHTWFGIGLKKLYQPILIILCGVTVLPSFGLYHSLLSATNKIQKDWNAVFLSIKVTHHLTKRLPAVPKNESNETHNMKLHVAKLLDMENS